MKYVVFFYPRTKSDANSILYSIYKGSGSLGTPLLQAYRGPRKPFKGLARAYGRPVSGFLVNKPTCDLCTVHYIDHNTNIARAKLM